MCTFWQLTVKTKAIIHFQIPKNMEVLNQPWKKNEISSICFCRSKRQTEDSHHVWNLAISYSGWFEWGECVLVKVPESVGSISRKSHIQIAMPFWNWLRSSQLKYGRAKMKWTWYFLSGGICTWGFKRYHYTEKGHLDAGPRQFWPGPPLLLFLALRTCNRIK